MRAPLDEAALDRLRHAARGEGLRQARRDRGRLRDRLPRPDARRGRPDRLLGHVPALARRHPVRAREPGLARGACQPPVQVRGRHARVRHAVDRDERALRRLDCRRPGRRRTPSTGRTCSVGAPARRPRGEAGPADLERALHRARRGAVVARRRAGRGPRAREVLRRAGRAPGRTGARQPQDAHLDAPERVQPLLDEHPAIQGRLHARLPDRQRDRRARGPEAGVRLVRGREAPGTGCAAGRRESSASRMSGHGAGGSSTRPATIRTSQAPPASGSGPATRSSATLRPRTASTRIYAPGRSTCPPASAASMAT